MTPNPFDQAARYLAKLDPAGFLLWLIAVASDTVRFRSWLDTRTIPFPGEPERTCDTVASLVDAHDSDLWWALPIEFQRRPASDMFGRVLEYLARLWRELRLPNSPTGRYNIVAAVVNLTGVGRTSRDMKLAQTGMHTRLLVAERNLANEDAAATLAAIADGRIARCVLPWIPLMRAGGESSIIDRWRELALVEPDLRSRADYGGLALVFAELTDCRPQWQKALEGWNMEQSLQVLEWQADAEKRGRAEGKAEGKAESVLKILEKRFTGQVPLDLVTAIRGSSDLSLLDTWFDAAFASDSLDEFRRRVKL